MLHLLLNAETQELLREGLVVSYHSILQITEKGFYIFYVLDQRVHVQLRNKS